MSIASNTIFEVRSTGSPTNGIGYTPGSSGTDWTQQAAAQYASTDLVLTTGSVNISSATANWGTDVVGNLIYVAGGTGAVVGNWYQIQVRNSATSISVDRSTGLVTGTGATGNIGGAADSLGTIASMPVVASGMIVYVKGNTAVSSATINVPGGVVNNGLNVIFVGYQTNRTQSNTDAICTISYNVSRVTMCQSRSLWYNFLFDGNAQATARLCASNDVFFRCLIQKMNVASSGGIGSFHSCGATLNSAAVFTNPAFSCEAWANTATPFASLTYVDCISYGNTGGADGFNMGGNCVTARNCDSYGNAGAGFNLGSNSRVAVMDNCHAEGNTGAGFLVGNNSFGTLLNSCSTFGNTGSSISGTATMTKFNFQALTVGTVYTNAAGNDFSKNNLVNQGAALRAAADPQTFPRGLTANKRDAGAAQHGDPAAGGIMVVQGFLGGYNG